jgi:hypothetical protein
MAQHTFLIEEFVQFPWAILQWIPASISLQLLGGHYGIISGWRACCSLRPSHSDPAHELGFVKQQLGGRQPIHHLARKATDGLSTPAHIDRGEHCSICRLNHVPESSPSQLSWRITGWWPCVEIQPLLQDRLSDCVGGRDLVGGSLARTELNSANGNCIAPDQPIARFLKP